MSEWQDIVTAPKDGTRILVACQDRQYVVAWMTRPWNTWGVSVRDADGRESAFHDVGRLVPFDAVVVREGPTHWMPLPDPPVAP